MKVSDWEINHAVQLLEGFGYIVRRPKEAKAVVAVEIIPEQGSPYHLGCRVDVQHRGEHYAIAELFPVELLCDPDKAVFRDDVAPKRLAVQLGRYIGDQLTGQISAQLAEKIKPFIPEKRLSLFEIEAFIAMALDGRYSRKDLDKEFPQFKDGQGN